MKVISVLFSTLICGEILFNLDAEQVSTKVYSYREWKVNGSTLREVLVPMFSCSKDEDCSVQRNIKSSSCILVDWHGKSCGCESTHVPQIDEEGTFIGCLEKANKLHDPCVENIQCSTVDMEYVECKRLGKCGCVHGAITDPKTGRCLVGASMGGPCSSDESCQLLTLLSICNKTSSQCSCPQNRFYNEENKIRSCEERARKIGDKCDFFYEPISPFQRGKRYNCDLIKGAECDIFTRTCTCRDMVPVYFPESSAMACGFDFDLTSMNRFALSPDRGWYMAKRNLEGDDCLEDLQCTAGLLGSLSECKDQRCACKSDSELVNGKCAERSTLWMNKIQYLVFFTGLAVFFLGLLLLFFAVRFMLRRPSDTDKRTERMESHYFENPLLGQDYIYHISAKDESENLWEQIKGRVFIKT